MRHFARVGSQETNGEAPREAHENSRGSDRGEHAASHANSHALDYRYQPADQSEVINCNSSAESRSYLKQKHQPIVSCAYFIPSYFLIEESVNIYF